jgi:hypothetical protein
MNQVVNRRPVNAKARVQSQANLCEIFHERSSGLYPSASVFLMLPVPHVHLNTTHIRTRVEAWNTSHKAVLSRISIDLDTKYCHIPASNTNVTFSPRTQVFSDAEKM